MNRFAARELWTIVTEQLNGVRTFCLAKAFLDGAQQHVANVQAIDADGAAEVIDDLPIVAIQNKRNPDMSAIPGKHAKYIHAPAHVTLRRDDLAIMHKGATTWNFLQQQLVCLHQSVNALLIHAGKALFFKGFVEQRGHTPVSVCRSFVADPSDFRQYSLIYRQVGLAPPL